MIKIFYKNDIINRLSAIITYGVSKGYSYAFIEEKIISSSFVNGLENNYYDIGLSIEDVIEETYKVKLSQKADISFKGLFIGESYIRLFFELNKSFEYLFLYWPLSFFIDKYEIYHEMDFSNLKNDFLELSNGTSLLKKLSQKNNLKYVEISKLTGIKLNTIHKYASNDDHLYNASYQIIHALSQLFGVKDNLFIKSLSVYYDQSIYYSDEKNEHLINYLGMMFASYFDSRIDDEYFIYREEQEKFYYLKDYLELVVFYKNKLEINTEWVNSHADSHTYLVIFSKDSFDEDKLSDFNHLKNINAYEVVVITKEKIFYIKKGMSKDITGVINKFLTIRAKELSDKLITHN